MIAGSNQQKNDGAVGSRSLDDAAGFGPWVKRERERRGWSQRELCDEVMIAQPYLSQIESGNRIPHERLRRSFERLFRSAVPVVDERPQVMDEPKITDEEAQLLAAWRRLPAGEIRRYFFQGILLYLESSRNIR
jgi:transcriptional regulator with XRE-family HTH domain